MRQALSIAFLTVFFVVPPGRAGESPPALEQARKLLAARDNGRAAQVLEEALPSASTADRGPIVQLLRQAYQELIRDAEGAGDTRLAAEYRDNLSILEPSPTVPKQPGTAGPSKPAATPPADAPPVVPAPTPLPSAATSDSATPDAPFPPLPGEKAPTLQKEAPADTLVRPASNKGAPREGKAIPRGDLGGDDLPDLGEPKSLPEPAATPPPGASKPAVKVPRNAAASAKSGQARAGIPAPAPAATAGQPTTPMAEGVEQADSLFNAKRYPEAGKVYARLAAEKRLPADRREAWAYCRWVSIVAQINAHPRTDKEWDDIENEVRDVRRLVPGNWYGKYLSDLVGEVRHAKGAGGKRGVVVRGSAPDESPQPQPRRRGGLFGAKGAPARPAAQPSPSAPEAGEQPLGLPPASAAEPAVPRAPAPAAGLPSGAESPTASAAGPVPWQIIETANFRIFHVDETLGNEAARAAEAVRSRQAKRWGSVATRSTWTPRCDIYLYPTPAAFSKMTGQPEISPGFSSLGVSGDRVTSRRVNLRADHPQLIPAILPHEVTHVVLADLFTRQPIPRWADEGIAVLSEPEDEQATRAADLVGPLREGAVFKLSELMATDSPNSDSWNLYYAQSVSLTQYLVGLGSPTDFVDFVRGAQKKGIEAALKDIYGIEGFPALESGWREFAARKAADQADEGQKVAAGPDAEGRAR